MAMVQKADYKSKMLIIEIGPRGRETPISWATGDYWALVTTSKAAAEVSGELFWRKATAAEIKALEKQRGNGKLPGW